ncbi:leucyl aminopeptidase family protein [Xanthovirga aplysinae]|uniref:leucyl aminopeptidase family protein n=1 Tax=Xanthovirga aplysinae TaxID=2529853 RepID=UPI0012BC3ACB|nr:leucyl aminopeptidase [Xanthovirga aplysinae]MTI33597.1 leucyl aminopeptidase [Xanthovirga aplysinae]
MQPTIRLSKSLSEKASLIVFTESENWEKLCQNEREINFIRQKLEKGKDFVTLHRLNRLLVFINKAKGEENYKKWEDLRKKGNKVLNLINEEKIEALQIVGRQENPDFILAFCEGIALSNYQFLKYKSDKKENSLKTIEIFSETIKESSLKELSNLIEGTFTARDLINEPLIYLTAEQLSDDLHTIAKKTGFSVEVFEESKIKSLKMGGLLAVNAGTPNPPTFNVLEYKAENAVNKQPIILVGKGVVYDTGGLSLKPTANSMDLMKSDMAGAAAVIGTFCAAASNQLPVHLIGLIPATENRPSGNAMTPGDVITMQNGKTVEILNTDAEGRLILADALSYASKYNPELVIDVATLTGAAVRAIGKEGIVFMGETSDSAKEDIIASGHEVYERLVEFPLWEEYEEQIQSDIADINNLGGPTAGATTAGMFLKHFINYNWLHLDIAGPAFLTSPDSYRGKNGTGVGVRLLYRFLKNRTLKNG